MHIKFISPRMHTGTIRSPLKHRLVPPQALLLLASLTPDRHTCMLVDENIRECDCDDKPDLVAISVYIDTANRAYQLADQYRSRGVRVVLGGLHVTTCPDEAQSHADAIVVGEADNIWPHLLADVESNSLRSRYCGDQRVSLDLVPRLRSGLINADDYASIHTLQASRGCVHRCRFCYQQSFYGATGVRQKPVPVIVRQIHEMRARHVLFLDDNLIADRTFAVALFTELRPLGITWSGAATANIGDDAELLLLARHAGCRSLFIGFESVLKQSLDESKKSHNNPDRYDRQIDCIHAHGIMINGSFVFGFDHDTRGVFSATAEFIDRTGIETANAHILTPYPGTLLFAQLDAQGRIIDREWSHYNTTQAVFQPKHMSPHDLETGYLWFRRRTYSWPSIIRRSRKAGTPAMAYWAFMLGCRKFPGIINLLGKAGFLNRIFSWGFSLMSKQNSTCRPMLSLKNIGGTK